MNTSFNLHKLNPWNWFKHEENQQASIPVKRETAEPTAPASYPRSYPGTLSPLFRLHQQMDQLFEDAFRGFGMPARLDNTSWLNGSGFMPSLDIASEDDTYTVTVEVPGLSDKDINVELNNDVLTIKGNKKEESENRDKHFYRLERHYGEFQRVLALPADAQANDIRAEMKHGVLSIVIPRKPEDQSNVKRIAINNH